MPNVRVKHQSDVAQYFKEKGFNMKNSLPGLMRQAGRLWAVSLAFQTQPFGDDDNARGRGEGAVIRDLTGGRTESGSVKTRGAFVVISDATAANAKQYHTGNVRLFTKGGKVYGADRQFFQPNASIEQMRAHHQSQRDSRGHVTQAGARTRDVGRWRFINQMIVSASAFQRYLKVELSHVGAGKGGWATCARILGGVRGIPRWITKHNSPGQVIENYGADRTTITLINQVPYASAILSPSQKAEAVRIASDRLFRSIQIAERNKGKAVDA